MVAWGLPRVEEGMRGMEGGTMICLVRGRGDGWLGNVGRRTKGCGSGERDRSVQSRVDTDLEREDEYHAQAMKAKSVSFDEIKFHSSSLPISMPT